MEQNKYDIFISYSRRDTSIVNNVVSKLEREGFKVWIDKDGIESGDAFKQVIVKAIEQSKCVLFFSSFASNSSTWTAKEIGVAVYENKPIIPILIDDSKFNPEIKFDLINLDYVDYTETQNRKELESRLIKTLQLKCKHSGDSEDFDGHSHHVVGQNDVKISIWDRLKTDFSSRCSFVSLVLYLLQIAGILLTIFGVSGIVWSVKLLDSPDWNFMDIYGKGFIPGFILSLAVTIANAMTIRWNKKGFYLLIIFFFIVVAPTIWNEFEEFIYFSIPSFLGIGLYFFILQIPYHGRSTWNQCMAESKGLKNLSMMVVVIWFLLLGVFPVVVAKGHGFTKKLYGNGVAAIDARSHNEAFYTKELANRLAFNGGADGYHVNEWYEKAIVESKTPMRFGSSITLECYVDYMFYLVKSGQELAVYETISEVLESFNVEEVLKEVDEHSYSYDRDLYRDILTKYILQETDEN